MWVVYLKGPDVPESSACRARRLQEALGATLLGLGFGLSRVRGLDRLFPLCFSGWRPTRVGDLIGSACHVMQAGDRLDLRAARVTARRPASDGYRPEVRMVQAVRRQPPTEMGGPR